MKMQERLSRANKFTAFLSVASLTLLEGCSSGRPSQEQIAIDFTQALAGGDTNKALSYVAPDVRRDQSITRYLSQLAVQIKDCRVDGVVVRQNPVGALLASGEQATVAFKELCGEFDIFGTKAKISSMLVGFDVTVSGNEKKYYVNPGMFTTSPVPVIGQTQYSAEVPPAFSQEQASALPIFKSLRYNYQLNYPQNWKVSTSSFYTKSAQGSTIETDRLYWGEAPADATLDIFAEKLQPGINLEQYKDLLKQEILKGSNLRLENERQTKVAGRDAWALSVQIQEEASGRRKSNIGVGILFVTGNTVWNITFISDASVANERLPEFEKILQSVTFT